MGKRGQNEGSIYKRKDGRWAGAITLGWEKGKFKRKTVYGITRKEVQEKLTILLRDQQQGVPIITEQQTLSQFLNSWLENCVKPALRPTTHSSYSILVNVHIIPSIGNIKLTKLNPEHLQTLFQEKLRSGLSSRTVQYFHAILSRALNQAVRWNLIPRNIAMLVEAPRVERKEFNHFTQEQAAIFLEVCKQDRLAALFAVALSLGLRRGETLGLRRTDIDLANKMITKGDVK